MNAALKSAVESALIALMAAAVCLWFLISAGNQPDPSAARMTLLGIGLGCSIVAHWTFMAVVLKRSGRSRLPWMLAIVLSVVVGTVVLLALMASEEKKSQAVSN